MKLRIFEGDWRLTSGFGPRALDGFHYGHDYVRTDSTTTGSKLFASQSGILYNFEDSSSINKNTGSKAKCIFITGVGGSKDLFAHLSSFARGNGAVNAGDLIGHADATGNVTGPHLHYGRKVNNIYVDPTNHLQSGGGEPMINDSENEYARWNKLFIQIRGRNAGRDEFRASAVGRQWLTAMEILSDDVEANRNVESAQVGRKAQSEDWAGQIATLRGQVDTLNTSVINLTKGLEDIKNEMASQEQAFTSDLAQRDAVIANLQKKLDAKLPTAPQDPISGDARSLIQKIIEWFRKYITN